MAYEKPPAPSIRDMSNVRNDGMLNVLTGLGTVKDVAAQTTYTQNPLLQERELTSIFTSNGIGRRLVEKPAEDALRRWFEIEGDEGEAVCGVLETLKAKTLLPDAYVWSRLFGGAGLIRLINDGATLDQPLRQNSIRAVMGYRVVDRFRITWTSADLETDANSPDYGQPTRYNIWPVQGEPYVVHASRISIIQGARLPEMQRINNQGWGASVLQGAYDALMRVGANYGYSANIMRDFVQSVLSIDGLTDMLAAGQDEVIEKRLHMLDISRSILNTMVIDGGAGESYAKTVSSVAGVPDLMDRCIEALIASSEGMPMSELMGRSASGLNANGNGELRSWYGVLEATRNARIGHVVEDMVRDIYRSQTGPTRGVEPEQWHVKWRSLYVPTDQEEVELDKTRAETRQIYVQMGSLDPDEVRDDLAQEGKWNIDTSREAEAPEVDFPDQDQPDDDPNGPDAEDEV